MAWSAAPVPGGYIAPNKRKTPLTGAISLWVSWSGKTYRLPEPTGWMVGGWHLHFRGRGPQHHPTPALANDFAGHYPGQRELTVAGCFAARETPRMLRSIPADLFLQEKAPPALHTPPSADQFAGALWSEEVTVVIHQAVYLLTVLLDCGDSNSRNGE
jgi:hypothetical protein